MKRLVQWSRTKKAPVVAGVLAATVLALVAIPAAEGGTAAPSSVLGVYVGYQAPATVKAFGNSIGAQPAYAMDFLDGDSWSALVDSAPSYFAAWKGSGYSMVWGIPILPNATDYSLADGAAGDYNSYFLTLAQDMVAGGQGSSIVRIGWEFNGGWFPWAANGQAAAFIGYWQQIVDTMRSVPGQDFKFEWNPTAGDLGVGNLADYYPGSAYVDYVGLDVYDQNWSTYPGGAAEFANIESEGFGLDWLSSFAAAQGKSIVLPEWGLGTVAGDGGLPYTAENAQTSGGDDPTFINDMAQWIQANGVVEASYWQFGIDALSPSSNPNSYAAFVSDFGVGSPPPTTTTTVCRTAHQHDHNHVCCAAHQHDDNHLRPAAHQYDNDNVGSAADQHDDNDNIRPAVHQHEHDDEHDDACDNGRNRTALVVERRWEAGSGLFHDEHRVDAFGNRNVPRHRRGRHCSDPGRPERPRCHGEQSHLLGALLEFLVRRRPSTGSGLVDHHQCLRHGSAVSWWQRPQHPA